MMISVAGGGYDKIFCNFLQSGSKNRNFYYNNYERFFLMFTQGWLPRLESESLKKDFTNFRDLRPLFGFSPTI